MRLDDLPESGNVEDRRGEGGFGGGGRLWNSDWGRWAGHRHHRGARHHRLGAWHRSERAHRRGRDSLRLRTSLKCKRRQRRAAPVSRRTRRAASSTACSAAPRRLAARFSSRTAGPIGRRSGVVPGQTERSAGRAQSAMGPFYCPSDQKVYLDTSFFDQIATRFHGCDVGSKSCQFSEAYVIAHEIGHHVQNLLGILAQGAAGASTAGSRADANHIQVRSSCRPTASQAYGRTARMNILRSQGKPPFIEPGDVEAALRTAAAIGDDTLQRRSQGYVVPDSFTHGSSEQRQHWFDTGFRSGNLQSCNTFASAQL